MKQIGKRTMLLGAAALCWGIMFPEYTFTEDSYTAFVQEIEEAEEAEGLEGTESTQELYQAVRDGKVRYRFRLVEYLKQLFSADTGTDCDLKGASFTYGEYRTRQICADRRV